MEAREMFAEVNALMGAVGKAFALSAEEAVRAVEAGRIAMQLGTDERGQRYVGATYAGKTVRLYQGAILHAPEQPHEGCGCGKP